MHRYKSRSVFVLFLCVLSFSLFVYEITRSYAASSRSKKSSSSRHTQVSEEDRARADLKKQFPNLKIDSFNKSPINNLFEIETGGNILYYDHKGGYLFFGDILSKTGVNITAKAREELANRKLAKIPLDKAIKIGTGPDKVILFTDVDCPYCKKVYFHLKSKSNITQYVFLYPLPMHPQAEVKSRMILSSPDPAKTYDDISNSKYDKYDWKSYKPDSNSASLLNSHMAIAKNVGIRGTPSLWINGKAVPGADLPMIDKLFQSGSKNQKNN